MSAPGTWLRAIASRACRAETLERLVDPVIADLQLECASAARKGWWRRGAICGRGYLAVWSAAVTYAAVVFGSRVREGIVQDDWAGGRFLGGAAVAVAVIVAVLVIPPLMTTVSMLREQVGPVSNPGWALPLLLPQALPIAIPAGLLCGIVYGLRGKPATPPARRSILAVAVLCSLISFAMLNSLVPNANQAYRTTVYRSLGHSGPLERGANELTFGELGARIAERKLVGATREARMLRLSYHMHLALSVAPAVFGLLGLVLVGRIRRHRLTIAVAVTTLFSSYFVLFPFYQLVESAALSPVAVAWTPTIVVLLVTAGFAAHTRWQRSVA